MLWQRFAGRTCVVTASSQGIGLAMAQRFALEGANVVISSRKQDHVDAAVRQTEQMVHDAFFTCADPLHHRTVAHEGGKRGADAEALATRQRAAVRQMIESKLLRPGVVKGCVCHVGKAEDRARLLEFAQTCFSSGGQPSAPEPRKIDVLVLNAAASTFYGEMLSMPEKSMSAMLDTNIKATLLLAQEAKPFLKLQESATEARSGQFSPNSFSTNLLITSSIGAYLPASPIGFYSTTKTALVGLTKALAVDYAAYGVRVNCVCPGVVRTRLATLLVEQIEKQTQPHTGSSTSTAGGVMRRVGEPHEIAGVAAFLCSSDASYVTGESVVASGGTFSRL